jgi:hypothetical protein
LQPGDVGAREHPIRSKPVEAAVQVLMEAAEWIGVYRVAGLSDPKSRAIPSYALVSSR